MTWQASSLAVLALVLAGGFAWYERRRPPAEVVALVATLAALAVVGRLAFAAIPNVKPTTDIVLFAGYALGPIPGFVVGAVTALASNVFLGQGPWTAWQMVGWGAVGVGGGLLALATRGRDLSRISLALVCGLAGLGFGMFMDVYQWTLSVRQGLDGYLAISASSAPYNLAHAFGNVAFCLLIGPVFIRALRRYRRRFEVRWERPAVPAAGTAAAALVVALAVAVGLQVASAPPAGAAGPPANAAASSPSSKAVTYLRRAQNRDGGFGAMSGTSSSQLFTGWSALGFGAAGVNPRDVARAGGRSVTTYLRRAGSIGDTGELERTILVLEASGLSGRRFDGRDLVAELLRRQRADGSWRRNVGHTAFGVLALRSAGLRAGSGPVRRGAGWLAGARNADGGFGFVPRAESDVDDTGAALQALAAAGRRGPAASEAVAYLRRMQNRDGGFGQSEGRSSNAQSTAWAVQGLVAVGAGGLERAAIRYLRGLQRRDGHIAYSRTSDQTPVWVTAQALTALRRKPFPLAAVPRKRRRAGGSAAAAGSGGSAAADSGGGGSRGAKKAGKEKADVGAPAPSLSARGRREELQPVDSEPASSGKGPSGDEERVAAPALAAGGAGALVVVLLLRRRLRARRPA